MLVLGFILPKLGSSRWSVKLADGSTFTIVDVVTAPGEEMYVGAPWKRPLAEVFKHTNPSFDRNFGHLKVTNESAISWQRSDTPRLQIGLGNISDRIKLVDAQGVEHASQMFFSYSEGHSGECGVIIFPSSLKPPAYLRIYQAGITNEFQLE